MDLKEDLIRDLARIEELTTQQIISIVKKIMIAVATGHDINDVNELYQQFYTELEKRLEAEGRVNPNQFGDLWEFYGYWKENDLSTYASRRVFVAGLYKENIHPATPHDESFWALVHPDIAAVARSRYESGHPADAVEASLKEINARIKGLAKQKTGKEYDGSDLMNRAFSLQEPVLILDDLNTEDGQSIQKGYMQIFAGAMTGIRNPKAHSNVILEELEAKHLIMLASLLMHKLEKANRVEIDPEETKNKLYLHIVDPDDHATLLKIKQEFNTYPGKTEVVLVLGTDRKGAIRMPFTVDASKALLDSLKKLLGDKRVMLHK